MAMIQKMIEPNTVAGGGGLSALLMPVKASPFGVGVVSAGMAAIGIGSTMVASKNEQKLGKVIYQGRPKRMLDSVPSTRIASGIMRASGGNPQVAEGMIEDVMTNDSMIGHIQNYGVTPKFVSAFYGM